MFVLHFQFLVILLGESEIQLQAQTQNPFIIICSRTLFFFSTKYIEEFKIFRISYSIKVNCSTVAKDKYLYLNPFPILMLLFFFFLIFFQLVTIARTYKGEDQSFLQVYSMIYYTCLRERPQFDQPSHCKF